MPLFVILGNYLPSGNAETVHEPFDFRFDELSAVAQGKLLTTN